MALNIFSEYAARSNAPDSNYPTGSFKDRTTPGEKDGTPLTADWGNDLTGFTDALLSAAGIANSGNPDTLLLSDRLMALKRYAVMRAAVSFSSQGNDVVMYAPGLTVGGGGIVIREDGSGMSASHRVYYNPSISSFTLASNIDADISAGRLKLINVANMSSRLTNAESNISSNDSDITSLDSDVTDINTELPLIGTRSQLVWSGSQTSVTIDSMVGGYPGDGEYIVLTNNGWITIRLTQGQSCLSGCPISGSGDVITTCKLLYNQGVLHAYYVRFSATTNASTSPTTISEIRKVN